jgi:hypothetical protein
MQISIANTQVDVGNRSKDKSKLDIRLGELKNKRLQMAGQFKIMTAKTNAYRNEKLRLDE